MATHSKTYQDFLEMGMSQLKDFLTVRGISISGYCEGMSIPSFAKLSVSGIVNDIIRKDLKDSNEDKITILLQRLCFSAEDVASIEKMTRGQVDTVSWIEHRKGRLTASQHHEYYTKVNAIAHVKGALYPKITPLAADIILNHLEKVDAVRWGKDHEKEALKAFYAHEATKHDKFKLESAGLFVDKDRAYIGASPDSVVYCKCHGKSVIEIKCPYNIRSENVTENFQKCVFNDFE
ncbi:hypothetical protein LOTGIDRAFT_163266 [Lottia gigantea]|uniref:YqaJ viral recombinase domain-containing protein n=1 Tax=Lottia gigantea TaxID=225164 RepID=V4AF07_LOTGI|nr:hypothetical protein LOTGIDRAFT_163266 [Lottia gigantea]ESO91906.1 hypothetical protein LOTGIDRAFT_163266 [Lottia gigantea]